MTRLSRTRRIAVTAVALLVAFAVFRPQLATAVVTRGDDALRGGDVAGALRLYRRALFLDAGSSTAADRLAFNLALRHDPADARSAAGIATAALAAGRPAASLFADRAFAELELRDWAAAERDFALAAGLAHDPRYAHFASRMALRRRDRSAARAYAARALAWDPAFAPARALLRETP
jgi:tetratricopeptide (TPR) repeat protein